MGKALTAVAEIGGAVAMGAGLMLDPALLASPLYDKLMFSLALSGVSSAIGAVADALAANRGQNITTRQAAGARRVIYGEWRVGGTLVFESTTGSKRDQNNNVIVLASHTIDGILPDGMYLDGRCVYFDPGSAGQTFCPGNVDGTYSFGGSANGSKHYDSGGYSYNFGGLVFASAHYGYQTAAQGADPALHANDPSWTTTSNGTPYLGGCAWVYFKYEYDQTEFASTPEVRFTVRGKNTIWDPRTGNSGYTSNWALCLADLLTDSTFGLGCARSEINEAQLIAAANLCDEQVALGGGGSERRYTFNASWDTTTAPGDAIKNMLTAAQGNLVYTAGQWYIFPAAAFPADFAFGEDDLLDAVQYTPNRSQRDLCNRIRGVYTAPNYPYTPSGDLYNSSGQDPDGYYQNNFNLGWQPTNFPEYAQDPLHGYASDFYLAQDGGVQLVAEVSMPGCISVATAQRLAKIYLQRNRQQGMGSLTMSLSAWRMMPMDVFTLTYAPYGWINKPLQVTAISIAVDQEDGQAPRYYCVVEYREYADDVYAWSDAEELTIYDRPTPAQTETAVQPPTQLTLNSGAGYDVVNGDGILVPRVQVNWGDPEDARVSLIEVQYQRPGGAWISAGTTPVGAQLMYLLGLSAGEVINVQVRSIRGNGAVSDFLVALNYTVSAASLSTLTSLGVSPGIPYNASNDATIDTIQGSNTTIAGTAVLRIYGTGGPGTSWHLVTGAGTYTVPPVATPVNYSSYGYVFMTFPPGMNMSQVTYANFSVGEQFNGVLADNCVVLGTYTACAADGTGGTSGGGGTGGNGGGGARGGACTREGTLLDTPDGPLNNIIVKAMYDAGTPVYLQGEHGPERVVRAEWVHVAHHQRLQVGDVEIECSATHTVGVDGVHQHCSTVPSGTLVDTRTGKVAMTRETVLETIRVLDISLAGPSHLYSVAGVMTHNVTKISQL